jgi:hypothetical protein
MVLSWFNAEYYPGVVVTGSKMGVIVKVGG